MATPILRGQERGKGQIGKIPERAAVRPSLRCPYVPLALWLPVKVPRGSLVGSGGLLAGLCEVFLGAKKDLKETAEETPDPTRDPRRKPPRRPHSREAPETFLETGGYTPSAIPSCKFCLELTEEGKRARSFV